MNAYATLNQLKTMLGITATTNDAELLRCILSASRSIDAYCDRHFFIQTGTKYLDIKNLVTPIVPDLISLSELLADDDCDGTFGQTWTNGTHYVLRPEDAYPKTQIYVLPYATNEQALLTRMRHLKATGQWGYGDETSSPWLVQPVTISAASAATTTVTASAAGIHAGMTLRVGTEDLFVFAVDEAGTSLTCIRGVNGSTAAIHSTTAATIAQYPSTITTACIAIACESWNNIKRMGVVTERIGNYSYSMAGAEFVAGHIGRFIDPYQRRSV